MRKLILVLALLLGACASPSLEQAAPQTVADAEKALAVAHLSYQAAGISLQQAAQSGLLHGADATTAKTLYDRAGAILDAADQADALANAQGVFAAVADATALIAQIGALTHPQ